MKQRCKTQITEFGEEKHMSAEESRLAKEKEKMDKKPTWRKPNE